VALDGEDRVALVRQWRLPANAALLEIPAGGIDVIDGVKEDPGVAARRELEEETGMRAGTWLKLAEFYSLLEPLLDFLVPQYEEEGKAHLSIAIGCTGGRHRSVAITEHLGHRFSARDDVAVEVEHRDIGRKP